MEPNREKNPILEDDLLGQGFGVVSTDAISSDLLDPFRDAASAVLVTNAALQTSALQAAMDNYAAALNNSAIAKSTGMPARTPTAQYKGFAFEEYTKLTLKINALAKGIPDWKLGVYTKGALPDGTTLSGIDMTTDIVAFTRRWPWSRAKRALEAQMKLHEDPAKYKQDMANEQYAGQKFIGGSGQGLDAENEAASVGVGGRAVRSDPTTTKEMSNLADDMKAQRASDYDKRAEKQSQLDRVNLQQAVITGAATGFVLSTIREVSDIVKKGDALTEDQFVESVCHVLCGTADGGVRGGAIMGAVQIAGKFVGKEILTNSLGAVPVMAAANTAVDFAKDLYRCFCKGEIDTDDLLCNTVNHAFSSAAGFAGAWAGGQMAGQIVGQAAAAKSAAAVGASIGSALGPLGTIVGAAVGGIVIGFGAQAITNTAAQDGQKAFLEKVEELNSHYELSGTAKLLYFADSMSDLAEFKLSFKCLLPCYNLISDLSEYNQHKKAVRSIHRQLDSAVAAVDRQKEAALQKLEKQHEKRMGELSAVFREQRTTMLEEYRESMNTYMAQSYSQFLELSAVQEKDIEAMVDSYNADASVHSTLLEAGRNRLKTNERLNQTLSDLMEDPQDATLLKPIVDKLIWFMQQDDLLVERQYISEAEALYMVRGGNL